MECDAPKMKLTATQESVLALALREAVTNIVRHASATACRLQLSKDKGMCQLQIQDDGRGSAEAEGNGLRGMRERVEALGGSLHREIRNGTRLRIRLPLELQTKAEAG
jgi:two-component system, NarL family, sensor histidine kinase DesK